MCIGPETLLNNQHRIAVMCSRVIPYCPHNVVLKIRSTARNWAKSPSSLKILIAPKKCHRMHFPVRMLIIANSENVIISKVEFEKKTAIFYSRLTLGYKKI